MDCYSRLLGLPEELQVEICSYVLGSHKIHLSGGRYYDKHTPIGDWPEKLKKRFKSLGVRTWPEFWHCLRAPDILPESRKIDADPVHTSRQKFSKSCDESEDEFKARYQASFCIKLERHVCPHSAHDSLFHDFYACYPDLYTRSPDARPSSRITLRSGGKRSQEFLPLLTTCRHIYKICLPILYKGITWYFSNFDDEEPSSRRNHFLTSPIHLPTFCARIPQTQLAFLRSITQRITLKAPVDEDRRHERPERLVEIMSLDRRWRTWLYGNDAHGMMGLAGLSGLRYLCLEFDLESCSWRQLESYWAGDLDAWYTFERVIDALKGLKGLGLQRVSIHMRYRGSVAYEEVNTEEDLVTVWGMLEERLMGDKTEGVRGLNTKGKWRQGRCNATTTVGSLLA